MNHEFMEALDELEKDRGIDKEILIDTIEQALLTAYKKNFGSAQNVRVEIDRERGDVRVFSQRVVVDESDLYDTFLEIELNDAREISPNYELGDIIENEVTPKDFGRIAAQTAKQVVVQRIREAEREIVYNEFMDKENEIVTGEVARVKKTNKGPQIVVSRSHPGLVKRLFEFEVPEIFEGIVQIKSVSREAGSRTKMAVKSIDEKIDPIGACVGPKGSRVKNIVDELGDEKIDIIKYSDDPAEYISASLSPSKVEKVEVNEEEKEMTVYKDDEPLEKWNNFHAEEPVRDIDIENVDIFFVQNDKFVEMYYNPDATAGGQVVYNTIPYELVHQATEQATNQESVVKDFFEHLDTGCKQYLIDKGTPEFEDACKELIERANEIAGKPEGVKQGIDGRWFGTMEKMQKYAFSQILCDRAEAEQQAYVRDLR